MIIILKFPIYMVPLQIDVQPHYLATNFIWRIYMFWLFVKQYW